MLFNPDFRECGSKRLVVLHTYDGIDRNDFRSVFAYGLFRISHAELYSPQYFQKTVHLGCRSRHYSRIRVSGDRLLDLRYEFPELYLLVNSSCVNLRFLSRWLVQGESNGSSGAWIPTIFFLVSITTLESVPVFKTGDISSLMYQLIPLFICNAYQIMQLHRLLGKAADTNPIL